MYKNIPIVLVASDTDVREYYKEFVTTEEGELLSFLIQSSTYLECADKCNLANKMVVETAIKVALNLF